MESSLIRSIVFVIYFFQHPYLYKKLSLLQKLILASNFNRKNRVTSVAKPLCIYNMTYECQSMKYMFHIQNTTCHERSHRVKCKFTICRVNGSEIFRHQTVSFAVKYHFYVATYVNGSEILKHQTVSFAGKYYFFMLQHT